MFKVALVNMPFSSVSLPSIALTQLRSVLMMSLGDRVEAKTLYLNHDVVRFFGAEIYELISNRVEAVTVGLGDLLFRDLAFLGEPDNADLYFRRHFLEYQAQQPALKPGLLARRRELGALLEELIDRYQLDSYQVVGFTSMFSQNAACFAMARALKRRNPAIVTAMGGANCETSMGRVIAKNVEAIDFVFSGPGLKNFPQLVQHLLAGDEDSCHKIQGVYSRKKLAHPLYANSLEIGEELDIDVDVPLDYEDFLSSVSEKLDPSVEPEVFFETSRGCWWGERAHCTFCGLNGATMKYRSMPPEKALSFLQDIIDRYSPRVSRFQSVDNIMPRNYLTEVFPRLRAPEHVSIFYEIKADLRDLEMAVLAKARVTKLQPGIESISTSTLSLMKKGTTAFQNIKFLKSCLRHGISPYWNLLIGFPGEQEDVYRKYVEDVPLLHHFPAPNGIYPIRFDRFSPYFNQAREHGLQLRPADFYSMVYPFDEADLRDMAYFFVDENYKADYFVNTAKWLSRLRQVLAAWRARWNESKPGTAPQLRFKVSNGHRIVYDSRSGQPREHHLGQLGLDILDLLSTQKRIARLVEQLPEVAETAVEKEVARLKSLGLLFQEGDFYFSLVMEEETPCEPEMLPQASAVERLSVV